MELISRFIGDRDAPRGTLLRWFALGEYFRAVELIIKMVDYLWYIVPVCRLLNNCDGSLVYVAICVPLLKLMAANGHNWQKGGYNS